MSERLKALGRMIKGNPTIILLIIFIISAIFTLITFPHGFAVSVGGGEAPSQFVPTIAYILVAGIFMTGFTLAKSYIGVALLLIHFYFLYGNCIG